MEILAVIAIVGAAAGGAAFLTKQGVQQWTKKQNALMVGLPCWVSSQQWVHTQQQDNWFLVSSDGSISSNANKWIRILGCLHDWRCWWWWRRSRWGNPDTSIRTKLKLLYSVLYTGTEFFYMPRNEFNKDEFKCYVLKLKDELHHSDYTEGITFLAHQYLNKVLDKIEESRY